MELSPLRGSTISSQQSLISCSTLVADFFIPDVSCCRELPRSSSADDWLIIGHSILTNLPCIYTKPLDPIFTELLLAGGPLLEKSLAAGETGAHQSESGKDYNFIEFFLKE